MKPSQRSSSSTMCGSRSPAAAGGAAARRGRRSRPRPSNSCRRRCTSASSRGSSRSARSTWVRWTTAPQCGRPRQRQQRAVAAVDAVEVHVGRAVDRWPRRRPWCAAPASGRERGRADDVAGGRRCARSTVAGALGLLRWAGPRAPYGDAAEPRRRRRRRSRRQVVQQHRGRQRGQPRAGCWAGSPSTLGGLRAIASTSTRQVGGLVGLRRPGRSAGARPAGPGRCQSTSVPGTAARHRSAARRRRRAPAADPAGLERHQRASGPSRAYARPGVRRRDAAGVGASMTSRLSRGVGHPQRDPQVGVGADAPGTRRRRALRGEHQVDAERAAALGDVDQAGRRSPAARGPATRTRR